MEEDHERDGKVAQAIDVGTILHMFPSNKSNDWRQRRLPEPSRSFNVSINAADHRPATSSRCISVCLDCPECARIACARRCVPPRSGGCGEWPVAVLLLRWREADQEAVTARPPPHGREAATFTAQKRAVAADQCCASAMQGWRSCDCLWTRCHAGNAQADDMIARTIYTVDELAF